MMKKKAKKKKTGQDVVCSTWHWNLEAEDKKIKARIKEFQACIKKREKQLDTIIMLLRKLTRKK